MVQATNYPGTPTPGRRTHLICDIPEFAVSEPPFSTFRNLWEMKRTPTLGVDSGAMYRPIPGVLCLRPLEEQQANLTERTNTQVIDATQLALAATIVTLFHWRNPANDLPGVTASSQVQNQGDPMLTRRVSAGRTWAETTFTGDVQSFPQPNLPLLNIPMDRMVVGNVTYPANQPFYLRFATPGVKTDSPDYLLAFYFGGPAASDGSGQYCLVFGGDGYVYLYEGSQPFGGNLSWLLRDSWRYAEVGRIADASHLMRIWPYKRPDGGGFIEFRSFLTEYAPKQGGGIFDPPFIHAAEPRSHSYWLPPTAGRTDITGPGVIRCDLRRDLRITFQFARVAFPTSGFVNDDAFQVPFLTTTATNLVLSWTAILPPNCSLTGALYDASTGNPLTMVSSTANTTTFVPNPASCNYYARFNYTSDGTNTPYLWRYAVTRDGVLTTSPVTSFEAKRLRDVSITSQESDPSHETARAVLEDPTAAMTTLLGRASIASRIEVEYDNQGSRSRLFRGYLMRANALRRGVLGTVFPAPGWRRFDCEFAGAWQRLSEQFLTMRVQLSDDPAAPGQPYKVTDVVRAMLSWAGYDASQIDVPDNSMRLWPAPDNAQDALIIDPLTSIGDWIVKTLKDYLGWFLLYDPNFGSDGGWRARAPSVAPYANVAQFVTTPPGGRTPMSLTSYLDYPLPTAPIRRHSLTTYVKPPEANAVYVTGVGTLVAPVEGQYKYGNWMINEASLTTPFLSAGVPNPDYLGRFVPLYILDASLTGVSPDIAQAAVDWVTRRYYDFVCHGLKMAAFEAPLLLIPDTDNGGVRSLRYYDPVQLVDGVSATTSQWLVRNVNPAYHKDWVQMARYELMAPNF